MDYQPITDLQDERLSKPGEPVPTVDVFGNPVQLPTTTLHCTGNYYILLPNRQLTADEIPFVEQARREIALLTQPISPNRSGQKPGTVPVSLTVPVENFPDKGNPAPNPDGDAAAPVDGDAQSGNRDINISDPGGKRGKFKAAQEKAVANNTPPNELPPDDITPADPETPPAE